MNQTIKIPSPEIVTDRIKLAVEHNQWSVKEVRDLIDELNIWIEKW